MKYALKSVFLLIKKYPYLIIIQVLNIICGVALVLIPITLARSIVEMFEATSKHTPQDLIWLVFFYCVLIVVCNIIGIVITYFTDYIERNFKVDLSIMFYKKLDHIDYDFHESPRFLNDYTRALEEGTERIYNSAIGVLAFIKIVFESVSVFILIAQMHYLAVVYAALIGVVYSLLRFRVGKLDFKALSLQRPFFRQRGYVNRTFFIRDAMADLKTTGIEEILLENNAKANDGIVEIIDKVTIQKTFLNYIGDILIASIYPVTLGVMAYVTIDQVSFADFTALTIAASTLLSLVSRFVSSIGDIQNNAIECKIPFELLDMKSSIEGIEFEDVKEDFHSLKMVDASFSYDQKKNVLEGIHFEIKKGEKVAIVGSNGAGKTTLVKLLLRLYDTNSGSIYINDQEYKQVTATSLRKQVGAVFQNVEVYAATIAENIIFRKPATEEDVSLVMDALKFCGLYDYVIGLEKGIDTEVTREFNRQGAIFSGGQIQRLAIARGFAQNYQLLILDEPSSALDPLAEAQVYKNMLSLGKDKTIIFISHRLTTTVNADRIYLFDEGRVIEAGTHSELLNANGVYRQMFTSQASKYLGGQYENDTE